MLFASEIKAILAHGDVHAAVNRTSLHDYLTFQFVLGEETLFEASARCCRASTRC